MNKIRFFDGGMGTMLQAAGLLGPGELPEPLNLTHPEEIAAIHQAYADAGAEFISTNTFGANGLKFDNVEELVQAATALVRRTGKKVVLDIGPLGKLLQPMGELAFDDAYDLFARTIRAGAPGADLVLIETMSDTLELKAAVLAAKENCDLPVFTTMIMDEKGRLLTGADIETAVTMLEGLGVDALGFNCSLGPKELLPMVEELRQWTDLPMILKPNAGLPDPATGAYTITPEEFAEEMAPAAELGVQIMGGCCGTTPDFIRALSGKLADRAVSARPKASRHGVCSPTCVAELNGVRVIGERINPTGKKRFQQALREWDMSYILEKGMEQQDAGAEILDVNVGLPGIDEAKMMTQVVKNLQSVVELPLQIDSSAPEAIEAGLRAYNGKPIVNSVNGNQEVLEQILPLCKKYGAAVVGLAMDHNGIPQTWEARVEIAKRIMDTALAYGIPKEDIYIDCLTLTVSAQQEQAVETLKAVRYVSEELGLHNVLGVSNISFGLPAREHITVSFLTQAMYAGLDLPIVNPNQKAIMDAVTAFRVLSGQDRDSEAYIARFAGETSAAPAQPQTTGQMTIETAIAKGLKQETAALTEKALETMSELDVVNTKLIPALDLVGDRYERQEIFLPQLINSANAACEGFEVIKKRIAEKGAGSVSKGKIVIATVHGDIHDIGKNIVKVVLENYGYTVIDLGRDVPVETVVEAVIREDVKLVGLSALMTTTVVSMAETIKAIRESGHDCKIWVGGAVLTPEYAEEIGADYYAKDAKQSVDIARKVLG